MNIGFKIDIKLEIYKNISVKCTNIPMTFEARRKSQEENIAMDA